MKPYNEDQDIFSLQEKKQQYHEENRLKGVRGTCVSHSQVHVQECLNVTKIT